MAWIYIALFNAALMGVVNIIDSHLLFKRQTGLRTYLLPGGIVFILVALIAMPFFPLPTNVEILSVLMAIVSGIVRPLAVVLMLEILKKEDVSQVIPITYTYPIFVALLAMPFLGEYLAPLEWLALFIVIAGVVLVSVNKSSAGATIWKPKLLLLLVASILFALVDLTSKYALNSLSFWQMFWIGCFGIGGVFAAFSWRPGVIRQLAAISSTKPWITGLLFINQILASGGVVLSYLALQMGPVSLVSTILSCRPMFVLLFAVILSHLHSGFLELHFTRSMLVLRVVATIMVVGGIAILHIVR